MCYDGESLSLIATGHNVAPITSDFRSDCFGMTTWHFARKVFVVEFIIINSVVVQKWSVVCVGLWCKVTEFCDVSEASIVSTLSQKDMRVNQTTKGERKAYSWRSVSES